MSGSAEKTSDLPAHEHRPAAALSDVSSNSQPPTNKLDNSTPNRPSTPPKSSLRTVATPSTPKSPEHKRQKQRHQPGRTSASTTTAMATTYEQGDPTRAYPDSQDATPLHAEDLVNLPQTQMLNAHRAAMSVTTPLQVQKLRDDATVPTRGSQFAAGYDLYAVEDGVVPARGRAMIGTGIAIAVPVGTYGRVAPRSGLAVKHSIATGAGVIDFDYRGEVKLVLFNHGDADFAIKKGDRCAQLVLERIVTPDVVVVEQLSETTRGTGGFGSTGGFGEQSAKAP